VIDPAEFKAPFIKIEDIRKEADMFRSTWVEQHAYEFAGRLLVPRDKLIEKLNEAVLLAESVGFDAWDTSGESTREYIAHAISKFFGVSGQVIEKRLIKENLWPLDRKS